MSAVAERRRRAVRVVSYTARSMYRWPHARAHRRLWSLSGLECSPKRRLTPDAIYTSVMELTVLRMFEYNF